MLLLVVKFLLNRRGTIPGISHIQCTICGRMYTDNILGENKPIVVESRLPLIFSKFFKVFQISKFLKIRIFGFFLVV